MLRQLTGGRLIACLATPPAAGWIWVLASSMLLGPLATPGAAQQTTETCVNTSTPVGRFGPKPTKGGGCSKKETEVTLDVPEPHGPQGPAGPLGSANAWSLTGNAGTNPPTNFSEPLTASRWKSRSKARG